VEFLDLCKGEVISSLEEMFQLFMTDIMKPEPPSPIYYFMVFDEIEEASQLWNSSMRKLEFILFIVPCLFILIGLH